MNECSGGKPCGGRTSPRPCGGETSLRKCGGEERVPGRVREGRANPRPCGGGKSESQAKIIHEHLRCFPPPRMPPFIVEVFNFFKLITRGQFHSWTVSHLDSLLQFSNRGFGICMFVIIEITIKMMRSQSK